MNKIIPIPTQEEAKALYHYFTDVSERGPGTAPPDDVPLTMLVTSTGIGGCEDGSWFMFGCTSRGSIGICIRAWIHHDKFLALLQEEREKLAS